MPSPPRRPRTRPGPPSRRSSAPRRCWPRSKGIAENRDDDAAILSQENGKVRFEAWVDSLVLEMRWKLALSHADEVERVEGAAADSRRHSGADHRGVPAAGRGHRSSCRSTGRSPSSAPRCRMRCWPATPCIVKPPLTAPLATTRIVQRIAEQLPPGVLNVVTGPDANMTALIRNPDVAKVCFTGSVNGGKKMMELASASLTRVTLELGGNDAAIILKDAIIDDVHLDRLFAAIYDTTGQICMNAKRLYVHTSRVDEVVKGLSARLEKVKLGYGLDKGTTMGPLHSPAQKTFVDELIKEAKESGAKVLEFGELPGGDMKGGNFVRPAIVVNPKLDAARRDRRAVRPGDPGDSVRDRRGRRHGGERHLGGPRRFGVDGRSRRRPIASAARWSAATCGSTITAPPASTCARRSAA